LPADRLAEHLKQLHPGMAVTHGHHESLVPGYIKRLGIEFLRRAAPPVRSRHLSRLIQGDDRFSVNVVRWGNLPIFMQVANAKVADGMFYQSMTVLGIIMLHQVQRISAACIASRAAPSNCC